MIIGHRLALSQESQDSQETCLLRQEKKPWNRYIVTEMFDRQTVFLLGNYDTVVSCL